jgi:hypothetical protein
MEISWKASPLPADGPVTVMASALELRRVRDVPPSSPRLCGSGASCWARRARSAWP